MANQTVTTSQDTRRQLMLTTLKIDKIGNIFVALKGF